MVTVVAAIDKPEPSTNSTIAIKHVLNDFRLGKMLMFLITSNSRMSWSPHDQRDPSHVQGANHFPASLLQGNPPGMRWKTFLQLASTMRRYSSPLAGSFNSPYRIGANKYSQYFSKAFFRLAPFYRGKSPLWASGPWSDNKRQDVAGVGGYFTRTTKFTEKLVPGGMVPVVVQRTFVTQKSYPAGAAHPPLTGPYAQVAPLSLE